LIKGELPCQIRTITEQSAKAGISRSRYVRDILDKHIKENNLYRVLDISEPHPFDKYETENLTMEDSYVR